MHFLFKLPKKRRAACSAIMHGDVWVLKAFAIKYLLVANCYQQLNSFVLELPPLQTVKNLASLHEHL